MGNRKMASAETGATGEKEYLLKESVDSTAAAKPKPHLVLVDRDQLLFNTVNIDELVPKDHQVRAIWELTGQLDLSAYYTDIRVMEGAAGRPAWDPRLLVSLWIFSYSKGVSSAREIEELCDHHPAYQWLTGMEVVNHHSLSDFRIQHKEALDELFAGILGVLSAEGLADLDEVMHDGTKVRANAGGDTFRREKTLKDHLKKAEELVSQMGDPCSGEEAGAKKAKARERAAREKQARLKLALKELEKIRAAKSGAEDKKNARASMTDPEARVMKQGDGGYRPSYNVQISTDSAEGVIVGVGVSQSASDFGELVGAIDRIDENFGRVPKQMGVDGGFTSRENIIEALDRNVDLIGSMRDVSSQIAGQMKRRGVGPDFYPQAFTYDQLGDYYNCPAGKILRYDSLETGVGFTKYKYRAKATDCENCCFRNQCCPQNKSSGRAIVRTVEEEAVTDFRLKMKTDEAKKIYKRRGPIAEFSNACIKEKNGLRQFRVRSLAKVKMEAVWVCLTHNIQTWIRLIWRPRLAEGRI